MKEDGNIEVWNVLAKGLNIILLVLFGLTILVYKEINIMAAILLIILFVLLAAENVDNYIDNKIKLNLFSGLGYIFAAICIGIMYFI